MSPRIPVPTLRTLAMRMLSAVVTDCISKKEDEHYGNIRAYLSNLPQDILHDFMMLIVANSDLPRGLRAKWMVIVMRDDIIYLDAGKISLRFSGKVLEAIGDRGKYLEYLNLGSMDVRDFDKLVRVVNKSKRLETLLIPYAANDDVLKAVKASPRISVLDVSGKLMFSAKVLKKFKSVRIKILLLGQDSFHQVSVDHKSDYIALVVKLLKNLPNLEVLAIYSLTGQALLKMYKKKPKSKTKLRYVSDRSTTVESIKAIIKLCPALESITLFSPTALVFPELECVKLNRLETHDPDCDELKHYLKVSGENIDMLYLYSVKGGYLDITEIAASCPELIYLGLCECSLDYSFPEKIYPSLESVKIKDCNITVTNITYFLKYAPHLHQLLIEDNILLTDEDIFWLCFHYRFDTLEVLSLMGATFLTIRSVEILMESCPQLKVIGGITSWNISEDELELFKACIASRNIDLQFRKHVV